ncbi:MAG: helix-turn-helix transcriptional regulator, partial [Bacillota bacterium]
MNPKDKMITARDLAEKLDLSVETIWRYTRNNKIPYYKVGTRQYRYKLSEVIQVLNKSKVKEEKSKYVTRKDKEYTYQDYLKLP